MPCSIGEPGSPIRCRQHPYEVSYGPKVNNKLSRFRQFTQSSLLNLSKLTGVIEDSRVQNTFKGHARMIEAANRIAASDRCWQSVEFPVLFTNTVQLDYQDWLSWRSNKIRCPFPHFSILTHRPSTNGSERTSLLSN